MSIIEDKVCNLIQERAAVGKAKYGTTMERTDLSKKEWLQHAQEEALDFAVYLEKLKQEACVLSKDDIVDILTLIHASKDFFPNKILPDNYIEIEKKLEKALNLDVT